MQDLKLDVFDKYYLIMEIENKIMELIDKKRGPSNNDKIDIQTDIWLKLLVMIKHCDDNNKKLHRFMFEVDRIGEVSDGDHSFDELYMHRTMLFATICNTYKENAWKSWQHHHDENFPMYDDYFIVGVNTPEGQYSYHCHKDWWDKFNVPELEEAPPFDGHQPDDVERLLSLIKKEDE